MKGSLFTLFTLGSLSSTCLAALPPPTLAINIGRDTTLTHEDFRPDQFDADGYTLGLAGELYWPNTGLWLSGDLAELTLNTFTAERLEPESDLKLEVTDASFRQTLYGYKKVYGQEGEPISRLAIGLNLQHSAHQVWVDKKGNGQAQEMMLTQDTLLNFLQLGPSIAMQWMPGEQLYFTPSVSINYNWLLNDSTRSSSTLDHQTTPEVSGMVLHFGTRMHYHHLSLTMAYKSQSLRRDFSLALGYVF